MINLKYDTEMLARRRTDHAYYSGDCAIADTKFRDAIRRGRKGAVVVVDENGEVDVTPLGGAEVIVSEAPNASFGPIVSLPAGPVKPYFEPVVQLGAGDKAAADAARIEKERKDRQAKMAADAKRFNQESFARNERLAQQGKAAIEKMWPKDSPKAVGRGW